MIFVTKLIKNTDTGASLQLVPSPKRIYRNEPSEKGECEHDECRVNPGDVHPSLRRLTEYSPQGEIFTFHKQTGIIFSILILFVFSHGCVDKGFKNRFEELSEEGISISFHENLDFDQAGGHLQGIQLYRKNGANYTYLSGSSSEVAFMIKAELGPETRVLATDTLMLDPYRHAGGFQISGQYLAVGIEDNELKNSSKVAVYDLANEADIGFWSDPLHIIERDGEFERVTSGAVGITELHGHILITVANWDSRHIDFYLSPIQEFKRGEDGFQLIHSLEMAQVSREEWSDPEWRSYQNINLFTGARGHLYLVGFTTTEDGDNVADIFRVRVQDEIFAPLSGENEPGKTEIKIRKLQSKVFKPSGNASFRSGAGLSRLPDGTLVLISCPSHIDDSSNVSIYSQETWFKV